jgi:hypothetical protein
VNGRPPSRSEARAKVEAILANIGAGAFIAEFFELPAVIRLVLAAVMLICFVPIFPSIIRAAAGVVRQQWRLFLLLGGVILLAVVLRELRRPALPEEILSARHEVIEIQNRMRQARTVFLLAAGVQEPARRAFVEDYEILAIEGGEVVRTYVRQGKRVAEDVEGRDPYPYARRYYQGPCNFATDHFDRSGVQVYLEYRKDCWHEPIVIGREAPRFLPPVPAFNYR